ncbi:MAG: hypothetical protein RL266_1856, partial [Bacteroidota bacterium]
MRKNLIIVSLILAAASGSAQEVIFDDPHQANAAIYLKTVDGEEMPVDGEGNPLFLHEVYRMSHAEIMANGWGSSVSKPDQYNARNDGPAFNLTYLDQV